MNILLLTNNILFEQDFIAQLNFLGHEVMCSKRLLADLQSKEGPKNFLSHFDALIFSQTVSGKELKKTISFNLNVLPMPFRKTEKELTKEEQNALQKYGVIDFFCQTSTLDDLCERLSLMDQNNELAEASFVDCQKAALRNLQVSLSSQEQAVFTILRKENNEFISRDELCRHLWNSDPTNSMESRLSGIVKNLREKIAEAGFSENSLVTSWGKGYRLKELVVQDFPLKRPEILMKKIEG